MIRRWGVNKRRAENRAVEKSQLKAAKRLLGMTLDGKRPIYAPEPSHSLLLSAAGGGKTTGGAMVWLLSMIADPAQGMVIVDSKDGELAAQAADMCAKHGRKIAIIDDFDVLGPDNPYKIGLNPIGAVIAAHQEDSGELVFATDAACHALIEEPSDGDAKNKTFRDRPRLMIEYVMLSLLRRNPRLAFPGGMWSFLSDPKTLKRMTEIDAEEEEDDTLSALAKDILDVIETDENYPQHRTEALQSLRIFSAGSKLHTAGSEAEITHLQLLQENYIVFIVGPQRHMDRLSAYYAAHLQAFADAQLIGLAGITNYILDEFTNANLKMLVLRLTILRAYGGYLHMIAQSRSEIERKYGRLETLTLEENAVVKQWFGFSSFDEAERVSKAMGEVHSINHSIGYGSDKLDVSHNIGLGKEFMFTPERLMRLPRDEQIIHIKDVGFIHARKIRQNQIEPYCHELADNPLEGGRLPSEPVIILATNREAT